MGTRERRERSDLNDRELSGLFHAAISSHVENVDSIALAAVGGYGRGELSPGSDLDLLIIHDGSTSAEKLQEFVNALLYPLWDAGKAVDHSVRTRAETREIADEDIRVLQGLLDIRYIAGNQDLVAAVGDDALEDWRKNYKRNLPKLRASVQERAARSGELAFLLEPDLKEARGGLRDVHALRAIATSGVVSVALDRVARAELVLSNVRDALHDQTGRNRDQLLLPEQDRVAALLDYSDADALMLDVAKAARSVDYVMDLTWNRIDEGKPRSFFKREKSEVVGKGLVTSGREVEIADEHEIANDPGLGLRAAAIAAQKGLPISIESCIALAENFSPIAVPWPRQSREDLVSLIGAGSSMIRVFEALDQESLIAKWIPEWEHVRFLPQRNVLHRHTVDRHMLETAVRASLLTRTVHRPDLLLIAALLHDIGKGFPNKDHSEYGEELIASVGERLGFSSADTATLALLVKHHLLLSSVATRRDLDDPETINFVVGAIDSPETLEILHALSIADGEATGRAAWSDWKAGLVSDLVSRCLAAMSGIKPASKPELTEEQLRKLSTKELDVSITPGESTYEIEILAPDQVGLLAAVAGVFSISRMDVRSARTRTHQDFVLMKWNVALDANAPLPERDRFIELLKKALDGEIDLNRKIDDRIDTYRKYPGIPVPPPVVTATNDIATKATVIEVRMHDRPGVLYTVAKAITRFGVDINSAIVATLGAEAFDTLYVSDLNGEALDEGRAKLLAAQVEKFLLTQ